MTGEGVKALEVVVTTIRIVAVVVVVVVAAYLDVIVVVIVEAVIIIIITIIIIIIKIMKIIYIAPNPLKGSRRFTKSVIATLNHKSSTIKYKHIRSSCILINQKKLKYKDRT